LGDVRQVIDTPCRGVRRKRQLIDLSIDPPIDDRTRVVVSTIPPGMAGGRRSTGDRGEIAKMPRKEAEQRRVLWIQKQLVNMTVEAAIDDRIEPVYTRIPGWVAGCKRCPCRQR